MTYDADLIICLISRIRKKANRFIVSELARHGLNELKPIHGDILLALFKNERPTMKELADIVDRKKSTVTTLVDKLIALGYVEKKQDETDCRSYRISLTRSGNNLKPKLIEISENLMAKVYHDMPAREKKQVVASLKKINDRW